MSSSVSSMGAANPPLRREETLVVALLLAFAGGYLDTYTWITHGILANAQTANLVFLWVHATAAQWQQAFHFVPPLFAFFVGVVIAAWLRRSARQQGRSAQPPHRNRKADLCRRSAQSRAPGCGHAWHLHGRRHADLDLHHGRRPDYSSVMITGNFRQAIEGAFAFSGDQQAGLQRKSCILMGVCAAFGTGAAAGALLTERVPTLTLTVPVAALLLVLLACGTSHAADMGQH
jgi:uncharacterized membrane protein YoaK (UPF0700 family)